MTRHPDHTAFTQASYTFPPIDIIAAPKRRSLIEQIAYERVRRYNAATTLAEHLDAIDFGSEQAREADQRADRIIERIMPRLRAPNGFADPHGFMDAAKRNAERGDLRKAIRDRLLAKIVDRDELLLPSVDERTETSTWGMA